MTDLAREYGEGLYALAAEEHLEKEWLDQLAVLNTCFSQEPDFARLLSNMALSREERISVLDTAFRGKLHPYVLNFLKILCERTAMYSFSGCVEAYRSLYHQMHGVKDAVVTTTQPLTAEQRARLLSRLTEMSGCEIDLTERVDPAVMGGVVLEMDGKRYDNSVANRLQKIHSAISGRP